MKSFKTKLKLNNQQKTILAKHAGVVCWRKAFLSECYRKR
nr:helix-turn-helix domain-containing protein [Okeania sp. SIO2C9]